MNYLAVFVKICYNTVMKVKYYKYKTENLLNVNKIVTIHYFQLKKNFAAKEESHDFWELVYADKHPVICVSDGQETVLNEGQIIFHKPNERHSLKADGKNPPDVIIISFDCKSEAMNFYENFRSDVNPALVNYLYGVVEESKRVFDIPFSDPETKKMPLAKEPPLGGIQTIKNLLEIFLIKLLCSKTGTENADKIFLREKDCEKQLIHDIKKILAENVNGRITVDTLCKELSYNRSYLFRVFKKCTGDTIMRYYEKLKIEKAKKLIRENRMTIREISEELSFDTPNYFSKVFKKSTGLNPVRYRKITE